MSDNVNHPAHYNDGKIEVIEFIEDKNLGFHLGNAVKYISRAGKKDLAKTREDLRKAIWYVQRFLELEESKCENREPVKPNHMAPILDLKVTPADPIVTNFAFNSDFQIGQEVAARCGDGMPFFPALVEKINGDLITIKDMQSSKIYSNLPKEYVMKIPKRP